MKSKERMEEEKSENHTQTIEQTHSHMHVHTYNPPNRNQTTYKFEAHKKKGQAFDNSRFSFGSPKLAYTIFNTGLTANLKE